MAENKTYPRISEKSWWVIRNKFKSSIPATVSTNYIKTLLTFSSDKSANDNIISPMKRLGLIDDDNKPTPLANDWRIDDRYKETCETILKNVYPQELLDLFPDTNVDKDIAINWFMGNAVGEGAAKQMTALFIFLKSGELEDKNEQTYKTTKKPQTKLKSEKKENGNPNPREVSDVPNINTAKQEEKPQVHIKNRPDIHIDLQIHISPESTTEQIETIFACMAKHIYGVDRS